jgi:hypothetical protein
MFLACLPGCHSNELVESELRARERELRETREALARADCHNEALQRELWTVRQTPMPPPPDHLAQVTSVRRIVLGRQTGGYDDDRRPGDEALLVVVEPRDEQDQRIKAPGAVHIDALEVSNEGLKTPLSSWEVPPEQLRRSWREGLFGTGYFVILPWKAWPTCPQLRVVVRFTLADGRAFEADKDVKVHLVADAGPPLHPAEELRGPMLVDPEPVLPAPRPIQNPSPAPAPEILEPAVNWQAARPALPARLQRPVPLR